MQAIFANFSSSKIRSIKIFRWFSGCLGRSGMLSCVVARIISPMYIMLFTFSTLYNRSLVSAAKSSKYLPEFLYCSNISGLLSLKLSSYSDK